MTDERYGEPIGEHETAALAVAFKALLLRELRADEGSPVQVAITEEELERSRSKTFRVDATPERMTFTLVKGNPPASPVFAAERH